MRFATSMSRSIKPRRPYKLDDTSCVNEVPRVRALQEYVRERTIMDRMMRGPRTRKARSHITPIVPRPLNGLEVQ
ncbi:hypothetical protein P170DRAFT_437577 [Aspergillus steynii IBT 23096]|uniref:Uncharacterized protein n=1 Tax=Aspergillus steynii IBT 23096 TaxID=1392250 RepID=A0A2I2G4Q0_9EURO|nr:uncharacterized protein P170DRAFT_437577 [Aspergillus steynii IBT 23096]PLB47851.1 hypothetical protein P170DRAFT_437577 [Aspergillus steynii IBT 23096]